MFPHMHRKLSRLVCQVPMSAPRYLAGLDVYKVVSLDPVFAQLHLIVTHRTLFELQDASNLEYVHCQSTIPDSGTYRNTWVI